MKGGKGSDYWKGKGKGGKGLAGLDLMGYNQWGGSVWQWTSWIPRHALQQVIGPVIRCRATETDYYQSSLRRHI